jgi:hypothetical protein
MGDESDGGGDGTRLICDALTCLAYNSPMIRVIGEPYVKVNGRPTDGKKRHD